MKLGYVTPFSGKEVERAQRLGFDCLEIEAESWFGNRIFEGAGERQKILDDLKLMADRGIDCAALAIYASTRALGGMELLETWRKAIELAAAAGVRIVSGLAMRQDVRQPFHAEVNAGAFASVFREVDRWAREAQIKIGLENWPGYRGYPWTGKTMMYSPEAWRMMFDLLGEDSRVGLTFDPSHLVWQGIDPYWAMEGFAGRIVHVHGKDTEIFVEKRNEMGIFGTGGWWTYRLPGTGGIDWTRFIGGLRAIGYDGAVCVEHEDDRFDPRREQPDGVRFEEGLAAAQRLLGPIVAR